MHLPTYLTLMGAAILYGIAHAIILWFTNKLLFAVSAFVVLVTLAGALIQSTNANDFEFKWMLCYTIPIALLVVSSLMNNTEMSDQFITMVGVEPPAHVIPGTSRDYENAAIGHYLSMAFPAMAWAISWLVQLVIDRRN